MNDHQIRPLPRAGSIPTSSWSYSHADAAMVYAQLMSLKSRGYHIWYDEGISPVTTWPEELAAAIEGLRAVSALRHATVLR
jgi:hypothetical protein